LKWLGGIYASCHKSRVSFDLELPCQYLSSLRYLVLGVMSLGLFGERAAGLGNPSSARRWPQLELDAVVLLRAVV
jgi:hypothetical protein